MPIIYLIIDPFCGHFLTLCSLIQVIPVKTFFWHPRWNGNIYDGHDIALAQLQQEVKNITLPRLPHKQSDLYPNLFVSALGWGLSNHPTHGAYILPDTLQVAKRLKVLNPRHCPGIVGQQLKNGMFCVHSSAVHVCKGRVCLPTLSECFYSTI